MNTSNRFQSFDLLATPVAVMQAQGRLRFVNAALEDALGMSRRTVHDHFFPDYLISSLQDSAELISEKFRQNGVVECRKLSCLACVILKKPIKKEC